MFRISRDPAGRRAARVVAIVLILAALAVVIAGWWALAPELTMTRAAEVIRDWGAWGVAGAVGLMVLHSFVPVPAELLACVNGMVYGPVWGTLVTWTGAMLGAWTAFAIARWLGRPAVEWLLAARHLERIDEWTERDGWRIALVSRFIPVIAFNLINYAAGLSRLSFLDFTWTTGVGILPATVLMVVAGDQAAHLGWPIWIGLAVTALALWYATSRRLRATASRHRNHGDGAAEFLDERGPADLPRRHERPRQGMRGRTSRRRTMTARSDRAGSN